MTTEILIEQESRFIRFELMENKPKTQVYFVLADEDVLTKLGEIRWYPGWRQYAFFPESGMVLERTGLTDITNFIKKLMEDRTSQK